MFQCQSDTTLGAPAEERLTPLSVTAGGRGLQDRRERCKEGGRSEIKETEREGRGIEWRERERWEE